MREESGDSYIKPYVVTYVFLAVPGIAELYAISRTVKGEKI